jgi:UPF0755 protein
MRFSVARRSRRKGPGRIVRLSVAIGLVIAIVIGFRSVTGGGDKGPPVRVVIPHGASLVAATDSLQRAGLVSYPRLFRLYARMSGRDRSVRAGTYVMNTGASWGELLTAMSEGKGIVRGLTIPEGFSLSWIVPQVAKALNVPEDSVRAAVRDTALLAELDLPTPTVEGYLFPETYSFPPGWSARQAVAEMIRRFEQTWKPEWNAQLDSLRMSRHDIVTLASIVEKEAKLPEERPVIAAVYHNRLRAGMLLQADPTVQYARGQHTTRVLYKDLEIDSPYNTYKYPGLPPGPIGSPGERSLVAALYPAKVPYLYFVAHRDGHHEFRRTFEEHLAAIRAVRKAGDSAKADSLAAAAAAAKGLRGGGGRKAVGQ